MIGPGYERLEKYLADQGRGITLDELMRVTRGPGVATPALQGISSFHATTSDDEIRARIARCLPTRHTRFPSTAEEAVMWTAAPQDQLLARAAGYADFNAWYVAKRKRDADAAAAQVDARARFERERRDATFLSDDDRELAEELERLGQPCWPWSSFDEEIERTDLARLRRDAGRLTKLSAWRAADKPRDLRAWVERQLAALIVLPAAALEPGELLEVWTRFKGRPPGRVR